ncbi:MAG: hypothetical protein PF692_02540 [Kiritimatiellae bacterium]|jgi:uncharacterized protein YceK|nr:hypothetical protein [Kiritimatiellia bacterium]
MKSILKVYLNIAMILTSFALLLSGCATGGYIAEDLWTSPRSRKPLIYAGTKYHIHEIPLYSTRSRMTMSSQIEYSMKWWHYVDLPLCICADTLLLPYTVPRTWWSNWKAQPTKEELLIRPLIMEYSSCYRNMRNLESDKYWYAQRNGLGQTEALPQNLDVYRNQMDAPSNDKPYVCPAGGEYAVRGQNEEPKCTVHGTPSETMNAMKFMYKEKRLPESCRDYTPNNSTKRNDKKSVGDKLSDATQESMDNKTSQGD